LVGAAVFAGRHWVSHLKDNPGAVTLATNYGDPFPPTVNSPSVLTEEIALGQEITPISESGTRIIAALTAVFLLWKGRKSLMTPFNRHRRHARGSHPMNVSHHSQTFPHAR
jgi:hypothetical protein